MNRILRSGVMLFLALALLAGCGTRSISNSGYQRYGSSYHYTQELNELEVLGIQQHSGTVTEADIQAAAESRQEIALHANEYIVLIQSGASFPDDEMTQSLKDKLNVIPLSGIPVRTNKNTTENKEAVPSATLHQYLRLSAAKGGANTILVYWGMLESGVKDHSTKVLSWVPIAGSLVPDETQTMRVYVKGALIDVKTGAWKMFTSKTFDDEQLSAKLNRESADTTQVLLLKKLAYDDLVQKIFAHYSI